jgi:HEAT repeat protein
MRSWLCALLLVAGAAAQAVDVHKAREQLDIALKGKDEALVAAALKNVSAAKDPRLLDDLVAHMERMKKELGKLATEIEKTGVALADAWKNVDAQGSQGRPVTVGTAQAAEKKHVAIQEDLKKLTQRQDVLESRLAAMDAEVPLILAGLEQSARVSSVSGLSNRALKAKAEQRLLFIHLLAVSASTIDEAREALVELMATADDPDARTAAILGLGQCKNPALATAAAQALDDPAMAVRSAAARLLARLPSAAGVTPLVAAMQKAEGRVLEEIVRALEDLTGRTSHDNAALWREWWSSEGSKLTAAMEALRGDDFSKKGPALEVVAGTGFAAGVRLLLRCEGLDDGPAVQAPAPGSPEEALSPACRAAISRTLQHMPPKIRARVASETLLLPFARVRTCERQHALASILAGVTDDAVAAAMTQLAGTRPLRLLDGTEVPKDARLRLRELGLTGLGLQRPEAAAPTLREILEGDAEVPLRVLAVASLRQLADKRSISPLITAAADRATEVATPALAALRELTAHDEQDAAAWRLWWNTAIKDFEVKKPAILAAEEPVKEAKGTAFYGIESRSRRLMFILDRSGSMMEADAGGGTRWSAAQSETIQCITALPEGAAFNIIFFSHDYDIWSKGLMPANKQNKAAAIAWIKGLEAVGATNLFDPLARAFDLAGRGTFDKAYGTAFDTIYLMSDGQPNRGRIIEPAEIVKELQRMNALKLIKVHTIGVGKSHDPLLMRRIAEVTGGDYVAR